MLTKQPKPKQSSAIDVADQKISHKNSFCIVFLSGNLCLDAGTEQIGFKSCLLHPKSKQWSATGSQSAMGNKSKKVAGWKAKRQEKTGIIKVQRRIRGKRAANHFWHNIEGLSAICRSKSTGYPDYCTRLPVWSPIMWMKPCEMLGEEMFLWQSCKQVRQIWQGALTSYYEG